MLDGVRGGSQVDPPAGMPTDQAVALLKSLAHSAVVAAHASAPVGPAGRPDLADGGSPEGPSTTAAGGGGSDDDGGGAVREAAPFFRGRWLGHLTEVHCVPGCVELVLRMQVGGSVSSQTQKKGSGRAVRT